MISLKAARVSRILRFRMCNQYTKLHSKNLATVSSMKIEIKQSVSHSIAKTHMLYTKRSIGSTTQKYSALPSHTRIELPALSPTMESGTIANWVIKEGESFEAGDLLAEIETDKATVGFEAQDEGFLAKIIIPEGTKDIKLGTLIAIAVENEEDVAAFKDYIPSDDASKQAAPSATEQASSEPAAPFTSAIDYPRHERVSLPALSPTMTTGTIARWAVKVGDKVEEGDLLAEIETDKATMAMEAEEEGIIAKILLPDGTKDIPLGTLLCIVVENEADVSKFADYKDTGSLTSKPTEKAASPPTATAQTPAKSTAPSATAATVTKVGDRVFASPLAKKLAQEKGFNLEGIAGSGPNGRVRAQDVLSFTPSAPGVSLTTPDEHLAVTPSAVSISQDYIDIPLTKIREVTAKRLTESKQNVPHYYLTVDCKVDNLMNLRKQFNNDLQKEGVKLSVNDFIIKAASLACLKVPEVNSSWQDTFIRQYNNVDVSVAVSTDIGLLTPIVFGANGKGLVDISNTVHELANKAKKGKLQPNEFIGGTFTISNLGMFGIKHFTAIINSPQACILAVGSARKEFVPNENSENGMSEANLMSVTLSCDHRVVDGAIGAQWLQHFRKYIENPTNMLL